MEPRPRELIAKARAGQAEALGDLCALYRNYLRMIARAGLGQKLRERVELSDVVQETLVEVVRQFPQFTGTDEAALAGWLRRVVVEKLADLGRYHSRLKRGAGVAPMTLDAPWGTLDAADSIGEPGGRLLDVLTLSQTSPSEVASRRELSVLLADALADLPNLEAEVLWLHHADGLSFNTIGAQLGLSRKTVRGIWARGLRALQRTFKEPVAGTLPARDRRTVALPVRRNGHPLKNGSH
jgi:RNA polymerase sigma-70 factor (ECF subfamily)